MGFFDKLKGGVEAEEPKPKKTEPQKKIEPESEPESEPEPEFESEPEAEPKKKESQQEGQLAIDVFETNGEFVIQSTIAGVKAEDLDITVENDLVIIRGNRQNRLEVEEKKYFYQECYWGPFSRKVILPEEVDGSRVEAKMKDGVLTLILPKVYKKEKRKIIVTQED